MSTALKLFLKTSAVSPQLATQVKKTIGINASVLPKVTSALDSMMTLAYAKNALLGNKKAADVQQTVEKPNTFSKKM